MSDDNTICPDPPRLINGLTPEHEQYLASQAIDTKLATRLGVRSLTSPQDTKDLGDVWVNWANFPALLFPWTYHGRTEYQVRPDDPTLSAKGGRPRKYVFRKGMTPVLWAVREVPDAKTIVIIEGTKQCLVGASHAPGDVSVYGIAGCRSWQIDGSPIPDLMAADGKNVVVILDADAADNIEVYNAGTELARALDAEGAEKVTFARLIAGGTSGLDDVLAGRPAERRAAYLKRIIDGARPKPADTKPKPKKKGGDVPEAGDRVTVVCNRDRRQVIDDLCGALLEKWDGRELFNHGGVISRLVNGAGMKPVDGGSFNDLIQDTAVTVNENSDATGGTTISFTWPDQGTMSATMSRAERFSSLERISHAPYVRPDGTIVTEPGYDQATSTILLMDPVFEGLKVPEEPSPAEIAAAKDLIFTEWLGDMPFDSDVDRANMLALIVTPAIRGMVPKVPLAVVDGLQMGVGKNLIADCLLTVYTGQAAQPMNFVEEADELRKQITSAFRTGAEFFVFDEAHTIEGAPLAQALTAETWQDRILGVSTMANFPNRVTWISLGNNVHVKGDLTRRVYRIALRPRYANPQDRDASSFRHPGQSGLDLLTWTRHHRAELMGAILTIVRAWFAQGSPRPKRGVSFGSFETWEKITGGIIETAGMTGFLDNLRIWRSESDFDGQYWTGHLGWLRDQFGKDVFRTADVKREAMADPAGYMAPPRLDDPADKGYGKALGEAYSRLRGRRYGGYWVERVGSSHGHVSNWCVFAQGEDEPTEGNREPEPTPPPVEPHPLDCSLHGGWASSAGEWIACGQDVCGHDPQPVDSPVDIDICLTCRTQFPANPEYRCPVCNPDTEVSTSEPDDDAGHGDMPIIDLLPELSIERGGVTFPIDSPHISVPLPEPIGAQVVTFDLETGDADDLYNTGPGFVRIGATATDDRPVESYDHKVPTKVAETIRQGATITGHNIMAFDLPALVNEGALTMPEVHTMAAEGRLFDALLVARFLDPPMARDKGVDLKRKYDLGTLATKLGLGEKLTDISKMLAKKYGGWANIPIDHSEDGRAFKAYMVQDVEVSRRLHAELMDQLGGTMPDYLIREHKVAAIAAQIRHNGFLVDLPELQNRVDDVDSRKADALDWLVENAGIPRTDAKGKTYDSPLSSKVGKAALTQALRDAGATSIWTTEKTGDIQVGADHMRHLAQEYHHLPQVREIAKAVYRIVGARSVYQTALDNLCPDGRVHTKIGFEQATGRWSVTRPGLTVFGKRGGRHVERAVFLPDPGEVLISVDLSQVDMRAVAGLSQDRGYIEMLERDDPHTELAVALFGDAKYREEAKAIGHGWNYGESLGRISNDNEIPPALVRKFDDSMHERFPRMIEWREEVRAQAASGHLLDNGFGRLMRPDPQRAHTQGPALMGQGAARDLMMTGLLRLPSDILPMLRAQIHDEVVSSVSADRAEEIGREIVKAFTFEWRGVPILSDVSRSGSTWAVCYMKS